MNKEKSINWIEINQYSIPEDILSGNYEFQWQDEEHDWESSPLSLWLILESVKEGIIGWRCRHTPLQLGTFGMFWDKDAPAVYDYLVDVDLLSMYPYRAKHSASYQFFFIIDPKKMAAQIDV